jgi:hypothetical protein
MNSEIEKQRALINELKSQGWPDIADAVEAAQLCRFGNDTLYLQYPNITHFWARMLMSSHRKPILDAVAASFGFKVQVC